MTFPLRNIIFASMTLVLLVIVAIISPVSAESVDTGASKAIERDSNSLSLASLESIDAPSTITADPKAKVNFVSPSITSKPKPKPKPVVKPAPAPVDAQKDSGLGDGIAAPYNAPVAASSSITNISDIKQFARATLASKGMGDGEFGCLVNLWEKESNWNFKAENASSGAYGIPQSLPGSKMASVGGDWQTNPKTQVIWGIGYIQERYQTPCGAWGHSVSVGWY